MKKRGLSGLISTIMIILIVLVSISLIWLFVQPFVASSVRENIETVFGKNASEAGCYDLNLEASSCQDLGNKSYEIIVKRGVGQANISEIKLEITDSQGNKFILSNQTSIPAESGFSRYHVNASEYTENKIVSVDAAGILDGNACGFTGVSVYCSQTIPEETRNETRNETVGCWTEKGVLYLDDFDGNCTRKINGLIDEDIEPIPYLGFHSVGPSHAPLTVPLGAKFHRSILSWHEAYDENGEIREDILGASDQFYRDQNLKVLLTIRVNDPNRSTCSYEIGERSLDEVDSYPKNETEWKNYVQTIVNEHYVRPILEGKEPALAGLQLGNEWSHQFSVNTSDNPGCDGDGRDNSVKLERMIALTRLTYEAIQEAQESLPNGEKRLPMVTFGVTGVDNYALKRGFNLEGKTYEGYIESGIRDIYPADVNEILLMGTEKFIIDASPYYDYLDIHSRTNYYYDHGYVAQWVRDVWKENGITGKGLSATEYGGPFHFYTTDYQEYFIPASLAHSFFEGFDVIAWASWLPAKKLTNAANFGLEAMTDWDRQPRQYARDGYQRFASNSAGLSKIMLEANDTYIFLDVNNQVIGKINITQDIDIPRTFEQCSDGLDNDNDGQTDSLDEYCGEGNFAVDVEFNETGIYF